MKKITAICLLCATSILANAQAVGNCGELFISEYVEGSQKNQVIEIYNPTEKDINLSQYTLKIFKNGSATNPEVIQFFGTILSKDVFVCGNDQAEAAVIALCDATASNHSFGGDDAIGLYKNDTLIDIIGEIGINPGQTGWQVGTGFTKDQTLVRRFDVRGSTPYWTQSVFEWDVRPMDDFSDLGSHSSVTTREVRRILVVFKDPNISLVDVQAFATRNDLILDHSPSSSLPQGYSWTYIFKIGPPRCNMDPATTAGDVFVSEINIVKIVEGDRKAFTPDACLNINEFSLGASNGIPDYLWHIRNEGNVVNLAGQSGTNDADADICECWGEGFKGNGIKVAVIDFFGFDFGHVDMAGQFLNGFNFIDTLPITGTTIADPTRSHAMQTSGLIAAIADNNNSVAGVAHQAKIIPYLFDGNLGHAVLAIEQSVIDDADIVNMSWSIEFGIVPVLENAISNAVNTGRINPVTLSDTLGIIFVGSAGNNNNDTSTFYPAMSQFVIGVGGTNPDDFRGEKGDGWGTWTNTSGDTADPAGSNFGPFYEVVAPAAEVTSTHYAPNISTSTGTSWAAPIVSGIAAILLSKNNELTWDEVRDTIIAGAEQVNTGTYDYNEVPGDPGRSLEMQYGRVNCFNSLQSIGVSIGVEENATNPLAGKINVYNKSNDELVIAYELESTNDNVSVSVYDMLGREMIVLLLPANQNRASLSIEHLKKGVYVLGFYTKQGGVKSHKFIKF